MFGKKQKKVEPVLSTLESINDKFELAVLAEETTPELSENELQTISTKATKSIAGFQILDTDQEQKLIDESLEKRRKAARKFREDRAEIKQKLEDLGITAKAIIPRTAWSDICTQSNLIQLNPDKNNTVGFDHCWYDLYTNKDRAQSAADLDWHTFIAKMFPGGRSMDRSSYRVSLNMPEPPDNVKVTLMKAQGLPLQVAAVADAIQFKETPAQIWTRIATRVEQETRYRKWTASRDPIVYTLHGSAAAIIEQFGDFPVEEEVVARVARSEFLIELPEPVGPQDSTQMFVQAPQHVNVQWHQQPYQSIGGGVSGPFYSGGTTTLTYPQTMNVSATSWTGR